ncbi:MAG: hypothetical protein HOH43_01770 [Candidatus Latescibacteria bacterium]|jgi:hypothetical protein|nr:hypothetical protein [Candidatus Latescibacterota bacterium]
MCQGQQIGLCTILGDLGAGGMEECLKRIPGKSGEAFTNLDDAYEKRDPQLPISKYVNYYDSWRSDPRHSALMRKIGLPQRQAT